jgi:putative NADH-flavin reductase
MLPGRQPTAERRAGQAYFMKFFRHTAIARVAAIVAALVLAACSSPGRQAQTLPEVETGPVVKKNITIALLGATGMVGGFVLEHALAEGYDIKALARTPKKLEAYQDRISIVQGDARDRLALDALLQGSDLVISALGPVKADGEAAKMISTEATGHIIELMPLHSIQRYILVSGAAVTLPGDDRNMTGWLMQKMVAMTLRDTLHDKQAEYRLLAESDIEWTLVRCPLIDDLPYEEEPLASLASPSSFKLRAGELAHFLLDQITATQYIRQGPFLESR